MSRFTQAAATMHTLSLAAMEEASRFGIRDADIDHLLLALTIDPHTGGQVLRGMGAGLDEVRAAVAAQHAAQLDLVGVVTDAGAPGRIVFHETSGYELTDRVIAVLKEASSGDRDGDSAAVLRALIDEPSGLIEEILRRLDIDPDALRRQLDGLRGVDLSRAETSAERTPSGSRSAFVPAPLADVWALLSSADRIPEWDQGISDVGPLDPVSGTWDARTRTVAPDGKTIPVKDAFRRQRVQLVHFEDHASIQWRFRHPDARRANSRLITFTLEHAAGGMQLGVTLRWETSPRRFGYRVARVLLGPVLRFVIFIQLAQIESSVTRVFR